MDTTAAQQAGVTVATIRSWCRHNVIAAAKVGRRWVIEAASLAHRISIGKKTTVQDLTDEFIDVVADTAEHAADSGNRAGLDKLLADVKARNITAIMGDIDPGQISLDDAAWGRLTRLVSMQRGCAIAEY